jgi:dihydropyrimidinase
MLDLIIRGGQVVTPERVGEMDIGVQGGKIVAVMPAGTLVAEAARVIEARANIVTYPAIKFAEDRDALIAGVLDGRVCTTATDEYTTHKDVKLFGSTIETVCGGHNGIEMRLPVVYSKFVATGKMSLQRFIEVTSTNAAKILGLYPQKGAIAVGSDADMVLIDPHLRKTLTLDDLHADSDYSIWEGFACQGYPIMTILRGKVIVEQGRLIGSSVDGRWLARKVAGDVLTRTAVQGV